MSRLGERQFVGLSCRWLDGAVRQQCAGHSILPTGTTDPEETVVILSFSVRFLTQAADGSARRTSNTLPSLEMNSTCVSDVHPSGVRALQLFMCENEVLAFRQPFDRQVDKAAHPGGLGGTATVVDEQTEMVGHVFEEQRYQTPRSNERGGSGHGELADDFAGQNRAQFECLVIGRKAGTDILVLQAVANAHAPRRNPAIAGAPKATAPVRIQVIQGVRRPVLAQIARSSTDDQLHRKQPTCNQAFFRRVGKAESDIHPILDPVADAIVELNVGLTSE